MVDFSHAPAIVWCLRESGKLNITGKVIFIFKKTWKISNELNTVPWNLEFFAITSLKQEWIKVWIILTTPEWWWGRCEKKKHLEKEGREGGDRCAHGMGPENQTQGLSHASQESVAAHCGRCFDYSAFQWV